MNSTDDDDDEEEFRVDSQPTLEELKAQNRWSLAVISARAAARVLPLLPIAFPDISDKEITATFREPLFEIGRVSRSGGILPLTRRRAKLLAAPLEKLAERIMLMEWSGFRVAAEIARATSAAVESMGGGPGEAVLAAQRCMGHAGVAAALSTGLRTPEGSDERALATHRLLDGYRRGEPIYEAVAFWRACRWDLELNRALARTLAWDHRTGVRSELFGALWPSGAPETWPEEESRVQHSEIHLEITAPPDANQDEFLSYVERLVVTLDQLHRRLGGAGLELTGMNLDGPVDAGVPVGSGPRR